MAVAMEEVLWIPVWVHLLVRHMYSILLTSLWTLADCFILEPTLVHYIIIYDVIVYWLGVCFFSGLNFLRVGKYRPGVVKVWAAISMYEANISIFSINTSITEFYRIKMSTIPIAVVHTYCICKNTHRVTHLTAIHTHTHTHTHTYIHTHTYTI